MIEPKRDEASEQQPDSTKADDVTSDSDTKLAEERAEAIRQRKRISREEVFDEYAHIPGYSDMQGFSNIAFVITTEEDADDEESDDASASDDQATKATDTKDRAPDKTLDEQL